MIVGMIIAAFGFGLLPLGEFAPSSVQLDWIMGAYALGVLGNTLFLVCSIPFLTLICPAASAQSRVLDSGGAVAAGGFCR